MAGYKAMYLKLFNAVTDAERSLRQAMEALQSAQLNVHESGQPSPIVLYATYSAGGAALRKT